MGDELWRKLGPGREERCRSGGQGPLYCVLTIIHPELTGDHLDTGSNTDMRRGPGGRVWGLEMR